MSRRHLLSFAGVISQPNPLPSLGLLLNWFRPRFLPSSRPRQKCSTVATILLSSRRFKGEAAETQEQTLEELLDPHCPDFLEYLLKCWKPNLGMSMPQQLAESKFQINVIWTKGEIRLLRYGLVFFLLPFWDQQMRRLIQPDLGLILCRCDRRCEPFLMTDVTVDFFQYRWTSSSSHNLEKTIVFSFTALYSASLNNAGDKPSGSGALWCLNNVTKPHRNFGRV